MPKVSVLLTSYNYADYLKESVESILSQTFKDFELIVVDDCSTDCSLDILNSFDDDRLEIIKNERNMGQEFAFELICNIAKGEYIAIADADITWSPDKLQKQIDFIDAHPEFSAVFTKANVIDENGGYEKGGRTKIYEMYCKLFEEENRSRHEWLHRFFYTGNCLCNPSVLMKKEVYKECYSAVHGMWVLQDMYKWIRLFFKYEIFIMDEKLVNLRLHSENMSGPDNKKSLIRESNEKYQIYELFYDISRQDFVLAFPKEAEEYTVDGKINISFALSKMLLNLPFPAAKAVALNKIFKLLNSSQDRAEILSLYGYNNISYEKDKLTHAPYLKNSHNLKLYLDLGDGFSEGASVTKTIACEDNGDFFVNFSNLEKIHKGKDVLRLRFDPDDSCVMVKIYEVTGDKEALSFSVNTENPESNRYYEKDGFDLFYTYDPSYIIILKDPHPESIEIKGNMVSLSSRLLAEEIDVLVKTVDDTKASAQKELNRVKNELTEQLNATKRELDITANQLRITLGSVSWKITKPVRAIKKIASKIFKRG